MFIIDFFKSLYRKLLWIIDYLYARLSPIYNELVAIIKEVKATDLEDEAARKAVFQKITDYVQSKGLDISDSQLNTMIEICYQLVRANKA